MQCKVFFYEISVDFLCTRFSANHLVANAGKCHLLTSSNLPVDIRITNTKISNVERVKLLGVNFEGRLNFDYHVNTLLKKANKKYHALARVCNYMDAKKRRVLMNAFITSQFSYCPLVWMFNLTEIYLSYSLYIFLYLTYAM